MIGTERPAVAGGTPVRSERLPYGRHLVTEEDIAAVTRTLRSDWLTTGPVTPEFERGLAAYVGATDVVAVSSGTAALHVAYAAADVGPGDEVILPPLTFVSCANAVIFQGATPVFADIDPETLMLDPRAARSAASERTKAILLVHYAGAAGDTSELQAIAAKAGAMLVEDASHALGARGRDGPVGSGSQLATFSFHPVKAITTGEGGAVATTSAERAARMRTFRNHGINTDVRLREQTGAWRYAATTLGNNYRLSDLAAALGLSQLRRLDTLLARRREIAREYLRRLQGHAAVRIPRVDPDRHAWHIFPVLLDTRAVRISRDELVDALRAEGIGANVHYRALHLHPYYRERFGHAPGELPVAEDAAGRVLTLPLFPGMTDRDLDDVVHALTRLLAWFAV